jgi:glycosyltransferase involved in cell wall biosynthesis
VTKARLSYAVVTPVRNEVANLRRLADALARQRARPALWILVDTGSSDETPAIAGALARTYPWIRTLSLEGEEDLARGGPVARAFQAGLGALEHTPDVVVKLDADLSFEPDYFERLLDEFLSEPSLGMASGTCLERDGGRWRERHVTGTTVWGAARAYRWGCLQDVLPLEQRMGWDGVDEFRANARGWTTRALADLQFRHHRREGERDGVRSRARIAQGRAARYLGYRLWYLALRALWHARREPAALAMVWGYAGAALRREARCADPEARAYLRRQQSPRLLPLRVLEAAGRRRRPA